MNTYYYGVRLKPTGEFGTNEPTSFVAIIARTQKIADAYAEAIYHGDSQVFDTDCVARHMKRLGMHDVFIHDASSRVVEENLSKKQLTV